MDAFLEKQMLVLARELAASHGTFFAAVFLADMNVSLPMALTALVYRPRPNNVMEPAIGHTDCATGCASVRSESRLDGSDSLKISW